MSGRVFRKKKYTRESRKAIVRGRYQTGVEQGSFDGHVFMEERYDCIYYSWDLTSHQVSRLQGKSRPVSYRVIPEGVNRFEYALKHALESIKRARWGRKKVFEITSHEWVDE